MLGRAVGGLLDMVGDRRVLWPTLLRGCLRWVGLGEIGAEEMLNWTFIMCWSGMIRRMRELPVSSTGH